MTEQFFDEPPALTLGVPVDAVATSLTLSGPGVSSLPATGTYSLIIDAEIITVDVAARSGAVLPVVIRGEGGSTPLSHSAGAVVTASLTARALQQLKSDTLVQASTTGALAYPTLVYAVRPADRLTIIDTSGWVDEAALQLVLSASPFVGERHEFNEDLWVLGRPPWRVSGNGRPIQPYAQNAQVSGARGELGGGTITAVGDLGASAAWRWTGALWARA